MTLNVSPTSEDEWGPDILGSDVLQNGQTAAGHLRPRRNAVQLRHPRHL